MNPLQDLTIYLERLERRLRLLFVTRGAAYTLAGGLIATLLIVLAGNHYTFNPASLLIGRILLFLVVGGCVAFLLAGPLLRLNRRNVVKQVERSHPQFQQRLLTFSERQADGDPFLGLLAADTLPFAREAGPEQIVTSRSLIGFSSLAAIAGGLLMWLILAGPGFLGYGAALLWAGKSNISSDMLYRMTVAPGNKTLRRKADQLITAQLIGLQRDEAKLMARYRGATKWDIIKMQAQGDGSAFEFLLAGVPETLEYYVESGSLRSQTYTLRVVDLPTVKRIQVQYNYPSWAGLKQVVEENGGDLRAVEGTEAELTIFTDHPLSEGLIVLDDNTKIPLQPGPNGTKVARIPMKKDGMYHVSALDQGEEVRLTEDYFIEAKKETPPVVRILKPGRDAKVIPIEEVPIVLEAEDDFGLHALDLHYSVNGGPEQVKSVLPNKGVRKSDGTVTLALEDFHLVPGDVVSFFAQAKDAAHEVQTDIYFLQAQPYEWEFSQSQAGGGEGQQGGQQPKISERQKEIIAATWNQLKGGKKESARGEIGKFLSDTQGKLADQAQSLASRMKSRELSGSNQEFQQFAKSMEEASALMKQASEKLTPEHWKEALPPEQQALQHVLRAESIFRQIQVAFGTSGQGGGGGGGRDLENLFDLELDTEKNQYESGQQKASADQRQKEVDDALQRLEQLARRQQELAQQSQQQRQSFQQRWQQEMLRREAEELKKQLEQLSRGGQPQQGSQQQQQSGQQQSGSQQQGGQQSQSGGQQSARNQQQSQQQQSAGQQQQRQGQQQASAEQSRQQRLQQLGRTGADSMAGSDPRLKEALDRLAQATEDMRKASEQGDAGARRAAERLAEAKSLLGGMKQQQSSQQMDKVGQQADKLAQDQRDFEARVKDQFGNEGRPGKLMQPGVTPTQQRQMREQFSQQKSDLVGRGEQLEKDIQSAIKDLSGSQRSASSKLRQSLGEFQQNDVLNNMRMSALGFRRGSGQFAWMREGQESAGLDKLRDGVKQAQSAMGDTKGGGDGKEDGMEKALNQVEHLREQLERMGQGSKPGQNGKQQGRSGQQGKSGQQPGDQQGDGREGGKQQNAQGQPGQQPGENGQPGQQPGQQPGKSGRGQQQAQTGQPGQQQGQQNGQGQAQGGGQQGYQSGTEGGRVSVGGSQPNLPSPGQLAGPERGGWQPEQAYREAVRDLSQLKQSVEGNAELSKDVQDLVRQMQRIDPSRLNNDAELQAKIQQQVLPQIEQLELQMRRKLEDKQGTGLARTGGVERAPQGYADAVAEYFRRLSKGKQ